MLKHQILRFWSKFDWFTILSRQKIKFSKIQLCHLVFIAKCPHAKSNKIHCVAPEKTRRSMTSGHTDKQMGPILFF